MARQVLPIAGAIVGAYFGSPQLGYAIGSMIGNAVDPQVIKGPSIGEARVQTSQEGAYRPVIYGTGCVAGNIINRGPRVIRRKRQSQGKGGGPVTETEHVYRTFAIRICEGPIAGVLRIWESEKLVYDARPESTIIQESEEYAKKFTVYLGGEDQLPDPALEAYLGVGNASSYRGTCYIVFANFDLTDFGDTIPQFRFEVASDAQTKEVDALVLRQTQGSGRFTLASDDSIDWSGDWNQIPGAGASENIISVDRRYVIYSSAGNPIYSDDQGETWIESTGVDMGGSGGARDGWYDRETSTLLIPGGQGPIRRSLNRGESFELGADIWSNHIKKYRATWVSFYASTQMRGSSDGVSWSPAVIISGMAGGAGSAALSGSDGVYVGARTSSNPAMPMLAVTQNGSDYSSYVISESTMGGVITSITEGHGKLVVCTNNGEVIVRSSGVWESKGNPFPQTVRKVEFNGTSFIAVGFTSGNWFIATSLDAESWEISRTGQGATFISVAADNMEPEIIGGGKLLSDIVASISTRLDIPASRYNVDSLNDEVDGLILADGYSGADAIRTLSPIYMFDAAEYDAGNGYRVHYRKRGGPVSLTISEIDLVDEPEESVREDALERPRVLHMAFQSPTIGYAGAKASPRRNSPDIKVVGETAMSVPVTFKDVDEAWRRADVMLRVAWAEVAGDQKFSVSDKLLDLVPTDIVGVSIRGKLRRMRVNKVSLSEGIASLDLIVDRQSAYTSNLTGVPLPLPEPPPPSIAGPTVGFQLDIPALTDWDDYLLYYDAGSGSFPAWGGYELQRSTNGGSTYSEVMNVRRGSQAIIGTLVNTVSDSSQHYTDTTNTAVIRLLRSDDEIESIDQTALLSEGGSFALSWDDAGTQRWEVMQYRDVVQNSNGDWELSYLLRGRLNTQTEAHIPGANFVLLETVTRVDALSGWLGSTLGHRQVSFGTTPETAVPGSIEYTGNSQREWPVAHLFAYEEFDMIEATCIPRHRFGTEDRPVQSINHSGYRWTATDGTNSETMDSSGTSVSFSVSGWARPITVSVAQLNRITGEGPAVSEILN